MQVAVSRRVRVETTSRAKYAREGTALRQIVAPQVGAYTM
jgi:hypothetical protein